MLKLQAKSKPIEYGEILSLLNKFKLTCFDKLDHESDTIVHQHYAITVKAIPLLLLRQAQEI